MVKKKLIISFILSLVLTTALNAATFCTDEEKIKQCAKSNCNDEEYFIHDPAQPSPQLIKRLADCSARCLFDNNDLDILKPGIKYCLYAKSDFKDVWYRINTSITWTDFIRNIQHGMFKDKLIRFYLFLTDDNSIKDGTIIYKNHSYPLSDNTIANCSYNKDLYRYYPAHKDTKKKKYFRGLLYQETDDTFNDAFVTGYISRNSNNANNVADHITYMLQEAMMHTLRMKQGCKGTIYIVMDTTGDTLPNSVTVLGKYSLQK